MRFCTCAWLLALFFLQASSRKLHDTPSQGTHMQWSLRALIPDGPYWEEQEGVCLYCNVRGSEDSTHLLGQAGLGCRLDSCLEFDDYVDDCGDAESWFGVEKDQCNSRVVRPRDPLPLSLVPVTFEFFHVELPEICGGLTMSDFGECASDLGEVSGCCSLECSRFLSQIEPNCWEEITKAFCALSSQHATNLLDLLVRRCDEAKGPVSCLVNCRENDTCAQANKALLHASAVGDAPAVKELLLRGADPNVMDDDNFDRGPLYIAARDGHLEVVQVLLAQNADVEGQEQRGATPLMAAAYYGHMAVTSVLILDGSPLDSQDIKGRTAVYFAAQNGHVKVLQALIDAGADPNVKALDGTTALSRAKSRQRFLAVGILIESGAQD